MDEIAEMNPRLKIIQFLALLVACLFSTFAQTTPSFGCFVAAPVSTGYDESVVYDCPGSSASAYEDAARPPTGDEKHTSGAERTFFGRFDDLLAAKTTGQLALPAPSVIPNAGGVIRSFVQETDQIYYRVFTEGQTGGFLTAVRPSSSAFAQEALALPPQNTAAFIQEVMVPAGTRLQRSRALAVPEFGRFRGGGEQFQLLNQIPTKNFGPGVPFQ